MPDPADLAAFRKQVIDHYRAHGRDLPWRRTRDPYRILVSEVMLQQTQVPRVLVKYEEFLQAFPDLAVLAAAPLADVLRAWQGLGYNRRARALKQLAEAVAAEHEGRLPNTVPGLAALPGVGPATAAAVAAFAFDDPHPFIETNIRTVYLHHFFPDRTDVPDREIMPLVEATLDREDPRCWYYALMDYGVMLKRTRPNPSRRSRHHTRQSPFAGSKRQLRAAVLRVLLERAPMSAAEIALELAEGRLPGLGPFREEETRLHEVLAGLVAEGFLTEEDGYYRIR